MELKLEYTTKKQENGRNGPEFQYHCMESAVGDWGDSRVIRTVILDTKTGSAREVASLKHPRSGAKMVLYRGRPLILGGYDDSYVSRSDGEIWNMDTETWEYADIHLNIARSSFSLVTMEDIINTDCQ